MDPSARSGGAALGSKRTVLITVAVGWFLVLGMRFVVPSLLPTITDAFQVGAAEGGVAVTVLWITYGLMQIPAGYYADLLGERVLLSAGLGIGALGLFAYSFTPTFALFVAATAIFGLGGGLYGSPRGTLIAKTFTANAGRAFGLVLASGSLGAAMLPAAAAIAVESVGWRTTLGAAVPAFLITAAALWIGVEDTQVATDRHPARKIGTEVLHAVREPRVMVAVGGAAVMLFSWQAVTAFLTTYLVEIKGFSQAIAGTVLGGLFLFGATSQLLAGGLGDRFGIPAVLVGVSTLSVIPLILLPSVEGLAAVGLVSIAIGARMGIGPVSNAYIIDLLPDHIEGTVWGSIRGGLFILGSFGSTLVGVMADSGYFDLAFYLLGALTLAAAGIYLGLVGMDRRSRAVT